jgi:hypothetical protein
MPSSTRIEDLPDSKMLDNLKDIISVSDADEEKDLDISGQDSQEYDTNFMDSDLMKKIIKIGTDSLIVFILVFIISNSYVQNMIFQTEFLVPYSGTLIGNGLLALIVAIVYFIFRYFIKL